MPAMSDAVERLNAALEGRYAIVLTCPQVLEEDQSRIVREMGWWRG